MQTKMVSELLDSAGAGRDYNKIAGIFNSVDMEAIVKINLPVRSSEDFLAWAMEKSGLFSVRTPECIQPCSESGEP
jgi:hypothetical protein